MSLFHEFEISFDMNCFRRTFGSLLDLVFVIAFIHRKSNDITKDLRVLNQKESSTLGVSLNRRFQGRNCH